MWRGGWGLLLVGCTSVHAAPGHPDGVTVAAVAPGDTLAYAITWTPGARATAYDVTVTGVSPSAWSVVADSGAWGKCTTAACTGPLPWSGNIGPPAIKLWLAALPWDSATFTVTVWARNSAGLSTPVSATWRVARRPGPPGPPKIDSTGTITGLRIEPHTVRAFAGRPVQYCWFVQFATGQTVEVTGAPPICDTLYAATVPIAARLGITSLQQARADSVCLTWKTTDPGGTITSPVCPVGLRLGLRWDVALR